MHVVAVRGIKYRTKFLFSSCIGRIPSPLRGYLLPVQAVAVLRSDGRDLFVFRGHRVDQVEGLVRVLLELPDAQRLGHVFHSIVLPAVWVTMVSSLERRQPQQASPEMGEGNLPNENVSIPFVVFDRFHYTADVVALAGRVDLEAHILGQR